MIKIKGKYYRNIQEQVEKNMDDIEVLKKDTKFYGPYASTSDIPEDYLEDGLQYLIGTAKPYELYLYDEANNTFHDLGEYPKVGPKGDKGDTGNTGATGAAAGFGTVSATANGLEAGATPTVNVTESGPDTAKNFSFTFGIPKGDKGDKGDTGNTGPVGPPVSLYTHTVSLTRNVGGINKVMTFTLITKHSEQFTSLADLNSKVFSQGLPLIIQTLGEVYVDDLSNTFMVQAVLLYGSSNPEIGCYYAYQVYNSGTNTVDYIKNFCTLTDTNYSVTDTVTELK